MSLTTFLARLSEDQYEIVDFFIGLLESKYGLKCQIKFKIPFFYGHSWICYLNPIKDTGIELAFIRARELSNDSDILAFRKRKQVGGVIIDTLSDAPMPLIIEVIEEAIVLDETVKYTLSKSINRKS